MTIVIGSFKVAFIAVLETLISARIADTLTGKYDILLPTLKFRDEI